MKLILLISAAIVSLVAQPIAYAQSNPNTQSPIQSGDRIAIVGNTFADQLRIHGYLETLLLQHTQQDPVSIRNLGWGGDMLSARDRPTGFATEEDTLTAHKTDVIIACFGMGESFEGEEGLPEFKNQLQAFIASHAGKKYNGKTEVRLVLVSPIACEDMGKLTPSRDKRNGELSAYTQAMQEVASNANVPFVNLFDKSLYLMNEATGPKLTNNGIHLNDYGYWAVSHAFFDQLTANKKTQNQSAWMIRIDAANKPTGVPNSSDFRGVEVSDVAANGSGLRFRVLEKSMPRLPPPTDRPLPPQLEFVRDTLVVKNLKPGKYRLTIDGASVATTTAEIWAEGVPIDSSPTHVALESYRDLVNDKNLQFTYSWKALNQVHIVGERRKSPSGKSLPGEVIEFNRLANDLDTTLGIGIELKTRDWELSRVED